jgi:hypothetical protein
MSSSSFKARSTIICSISSPSSLSESESSNDDESSNKK